MTTAVPPAVVFPALGGQPATEGVVASGRGRAGSAPTLAVVLSATRRGPLIEAGSNRWLMSGAPPLRQGATLSLELGAAGRRGQSARLLAIAERALEPPLAVRLEQASTATSLRPPVEDTPEPPAGVQVEARLIGPSGRPVGPPALIWLAIAGAAPGAGRVAAAEGAPPQGSVPGHQAQPAVQTPAGGALAAEVVGRDAAGRLLLSAVGLSLRLEARLDLPLGARLQLVLPHGLGWRLSTAAPAAGDDPLRQVIEALLHRPAASGDGPMAGALRLPGADHALAAHLLRWVEALGANPPSAETEPGAQPEPEDAHAPLRSVLGELGRSARALQAGGWRVLLMPLGVEDPGPLKLYLRDLPLDPERDPRPGRDRQSATRRAIFEVELSQLGRCQLDVLCQALRFDLVVRTEAPLPADLQDDIHILVQAASEVAGWAGKVEFRAAALVVLPEPRATIGRQVTA